MTPQPTQECAQATPPENSRKASSPQNHAPSQLDASPLIGGARDSSRSIFYRWPKDLLTSLNQDTGWRLAGKLIVVLWGLAGLWLTWQTFQTNLRLQQLGHAEEAYSTFLTDLGSDSGRLRSDALSRVPSLLTQRVHPRAVISPFESLKLLVGVGTEGRPVFLEPGRRQLHEYIHSGHKVDEAVAASESKAFVNALTTLGSQGWFFGESDTTSRRHRTLAWLWSAPPEGAQAESISLARSLFRQARIVGIDLSGFQLSGGDFTGARLFHPLFAKAILNDSSFREARLVRADLSNAQLRRSQMQKVRLEDSTLYGCEMQSANLGGAEFERSFISRLVLASLPGGPVTDLSRAEFVDCTISDIDAQGANLFGIRIRANDSTTSFSLGATHSDFSGADLRSSLLDGVNFSDSRLVSTHLEAASARFTRFNFADLHGVMLDKADLTGADLSDVQGLGIAELRSGRGILSCANANFASVKGLNRDQMEELLKMGAVVIPSRARWQAFKQQGFPTKRWREFAQPIAESGSNAGS